MLLPVLVGDVNVVDVVKALFDVVTAAATVTWRSYFRMQYSRGTILNGTHQVTLSSMHTITTVVLV